MSGVKKKGGKSSTSSKEMEDFLAASAVPAGS